MMETFEVVFPGGAGIDKHHKHFVADLDDWGEDSLAAQIWRYVTPIICGDTPLDQDEDEWTVMVEVVVHTTELFGKVIIVNRERQDSDDTMASWRSTTTDTRFNILRVAL